VTISISGTPARLKSTTLYPRPACCMRAVSSSRWARVIPMRTLPPSATTGTSSVPFEHSGRAYWLIW
jgi:hypothetical protein